MGDPEHETPQPPASGVPVAPKQKKCGFFIFILSAEPEWNASRYDKARTVEFTFWCECGVSGGGPPQSAKTPEYRMKRGEVTHFPRLQVYNSRQAGYLPDCPGKIDCTLSVKLEEVGLFGESHVAHVRVDGPCDGTTWRAEGSVACYSHFVWQKVGMSIMGETKYEYVRFEYEVVTECFFV